jgi:hypothetical protein
MLIPAFNLKFKSTKTIYEVEAICTVEEGEFNSTLNPSIRPNRDITNQNVESFATSSDFNPYVTTIGLYNQYAQLLVVGKLAQAIKIPDKGDISFVIKYDV